MPYKKNYHSKLVPNQCYHIYNHAIGQEDLFKKPENFDFFWEKWNKYISPYFSNYAYCFMPNHFHVLSKAKSITPIIKKQIENEATQKANAFLNNEIEVSTFYESQFKRLFTSYTNSINKQERKRHGSLFKAKFKRTLISNQDDFIYFLQYIHHNPIHHEFTQEYLEWDYCSYHLYYDDLEMEGISKRPVLQLFSSQNDKTGLYGFIKSHEDFKKNFKSH